MPEISRRRFLAVAGTAAASVWIATEARELFAAGAYAAQAKKFEVFSATDAADIEAATAQILPTDDTPGAREARVVYFIDRSLTTFAKGQKKTFIDGAKELRKRAAQIQPGAKTFAALPADKQIAVIASLEKDKHEFFRALRQSTIVGMLASPEYGGNFEKTGWKWLGFNDQFSWAAPFGWYDRNV
jgi:gluconate 2-dehydrogenase gamma chain